MTEYELVREIHNLCPNNQMRDVFIQEIQTEDPEAYVCSLLQGRSVEISAERREDGSVVVHADCDGLIQTFYFTPA